MCPHCGSNESSCSVWDEGGSRHVKCHRASCGAYMRFPVYGATSNDKYEQTIANNMLQPFPGHKFPSNMDPVPGVEQDNWGNWLIPILGPDSRERGIMQYWRNPKRRKIWKAKHEPMLSWTPTGDFYDGVWLVEDQISAWKLWDVASVRAVALLGTDLSAEKVAEIQKHANHVTIALDADATAKAFILARKWGAAFQSCRVWILTRDIKDMSAKDIQRMAIDAGHCDFSSERSFAGSV